MKLSKLCNEIGVFCTEMLSEKEIFGVTSNSKKVKRNYLFVCLHGLHTDGHEYIGEALQNGASAIVTEDDICGDEIIKVKNARRFLSSASDILCGKPSAKMRFVGVTGTNGKTSVSSMLWHILNASGKRCSLMGTLGAFTPNGERLYTSSEPHANMTTPDPEQLYPLLSRLYEAGSDTVVMETSSHSLLLDKLHPIYFDVGIFTNLTQDHLDFHGDMENYFLAKFKLFDKCKFGIINIDDAYGKRLAAKVRHKKCCSVNQKCDFTAKDARFSCDGGMAYRLIAEDKEIYVKCPPFGSFSVMNSMQAIAAAHELGLPLENAVKALEDFSGVDGRLERVEIPKRFGFSVFIDYAHTPDALFKVIKTLKEVTAGRLILLFGCGGDRDRTKRAEMGRIATENADLAIITSDNPRQEDKNKIINDILSGVDGKDNYTVICERKDAIRYAVKTAEQGDTILLAGKGHERYEIVGKEKIFFDERELVRAYIKNREKEEVQ